ncbi:MAG: methyl-accepting chemotaxis protein, partial [Nitrospira sp.]
MLVIQNLRHPEKLTKALRELGARHVGYGAQPAQYDAVGENLLAVLGEFAGNAWTSDVKHAWQEAYSAIAAIMLEGARQAMPVSVTRRQEKEKGGAHTMSRIATWWKQRRNKRAASTDLARLCKSALDDANTNVLMCDRTYTITYANNTSLKKLRELEGEIRKAFPGFSADTVVGSKIDAFHKAPERQRRILDNPANLPHKADIQLGPLTLSLTVSGITSQTGKYLGNMLEWEDVTAKRKMETEMMRLKTSLDNTSTNVLVCDRNYTIAYANKASVTTLRKLEHEIRKVFPNFAVDKVIGSSIDAYHKNPAHQRRLLDDPKNLPYHAEIKLGPLTLDLNAAAILSDKGEYLGNVVEWADVTAQKQAQNEVQRLIGAAVEGRLSERAPTENFEGFYRSLAEGINQMLDALVDRLTKVVGAVKTSTESVSTGSVEISQGTEDLSQRTSEQAAALEETSSAMEEMTSAVKQNADNAKQANHLATAARDVAEKGGLATSRAVAAMGEINKSSKKIADIITVIDEIAFQTNLLALNAAVEAARAGEHGRGFAVVAAEVRNLAQRSATAAKEIKGLINESVQRVTDGSELVTQSGKTLEEIVGSVKRVTDIIAEITAASQEQASGIDQVNKSIMQLDNTTQQNAALVEESAAACQNLTVQATGLTRLMESFKMKDGRVVEMTVLKGQAEDDPAAWREGGIRSMSGAVPHRMPTATHQFGAKPAGSAAAHTAMVKKPAPQPKTEARKEPVGVAGGNGK